MTDLVGTVAAALLESDQKAGYSTYANDWYRRLAQAAIDAQRVTIRTVGELDALPMGTIIRNRGALEKDCDGTWWGDISGALDSQDVYLPAIVLWRPDWAEVTE